MKLRFSFDDISIIANSLKFYVSSHKSLPPLRKLSSDILIRDFDRVFSIYFSSSLELCEEFVFYLTIDSLDDLCFILESLSLYRVSFKHSLDYTLSIDDLYSRLTSSVVSTKFKYGY